MTAQPSPAPGTALPWHFVAKDEQPHYASPSMLVCDNGTVIASDFNDEADAAYIVHAANALPALRERVEVLERALLGMLKTHDPCDTTDEMEEARAQARELIEQPWGTAVKQP